MVVCLFVVLFVFGGGGVELSVYGCLFICFVLFVLFL